MKRRIKYIVGCLTAVLVMASCSDVVNYKDEIPNRFENHGAPVITAIYDVQDTARAEALTGGSLKQMLRIEGANLAKATKITFNGVEVDLSQVYAESANCYLVIPRVIPEEVNDELYYETAQGSVTRSFHVGIPSVELNGLQNEFAAPGTEVELYAKNMDLYGFNDTTETSPVKIRVYNTEQGYEQVIHTDSCTEDYTSIVIPEDCPDNSLVEFTWTELDGQHVKRLAYRMTDQLMYGDFGSDLGWWNDWGKSLVTNGDYTGSPGSQGYNYLRITGTYDPWSWNSTGFGCNWRWLDASLHPENYVLKFEFCTNSSNPVPNYGDNGLNGSHNGGYCITLNNGDPRRQFDPWTEFGISNTYNHWMTISMPLQGMFESKPLPTEDGQWVSMELVLQPNTANAWNCDHCFAQFRIEPKNY